MSEPFIFISSYTILPDKKDAYLDAFREVADLVQAEEPDMLYFAEHVSEDGTSTSTVQVHRNAENMAFHMQLVADHVRSASQYLDFSSMNINIYGSPSDAVLDQMRELAGSGVTVTVSPAVVGFDRFEEALADEAG